MLRSVSFLPPADWYIDKDYTFKDSLVLGWQGSNSRGRYRDPYESEAYAYERDHSGWWNWVDLSKPQARISVLDLQKVYFGYQGGLDDEEYEVTIYSMDKSTGALSGIERNGLSFEMYRVDEVVFPEGYGSSSEDSLPAHDDVFSVVVGRSVL
jgi:hypothetical protein